MMPEKIRSAGNLSQNPQKATVATYVCFLTNFTSLQLTNIQANYWVGQMHRGPPNKHFGWAMGHGPPSGAPHGPVSVSYTHLTLPTIYSV